MRRAVAARGRTGAGREGGRRRGRRRPDALGRTAIPVPTVVRSSRYVRVPYRREVPLTRRAVLDRDRHSSASTAACAPTRSTMSVRARAAASTSGRTWWPPARGATIARATGCWLNSAGIWLPHPRSHRQRWLLYSVGPNAIRPGSDTSPWTGRALRPRPDAGGRATRSPRRGPHRSCGAAPTRQVRSPPRRTGGAPRQDALRPQHRVASSPWPGRSRHIRATSRRPTPRPRADGSTSSRRNLATSAPACCGRRRGRRGRSRRARRRRRDPGAFAGRIRPSRRTRRRCPRRAPRSSRPSRTRRRRARRCAERSSRDRRACGARHGDVAASPDSPVEQRRDRAHRLAQPGAVALGHRREQA